MASDLPSVDELKGMKLDPDGLMGRTPLETYFVNGYKPESNGVVVHGGQYWLSELYCRRCDTEGYTRLDAYKFADVADLMENSGKLLKQNGMKSVLVLPCSDCGTIFQSFCQQNDVEDVA